MTPTERSALSALRVELDLFANIRPVKLIPELISHTPFRSKVVEGSDLVILRELITSLFLLDGSNAAGDPADISKAFYTQEKSIGFEKFMQCKLDSMLIENLPLEIQAQMLTRIQALSPSTALVFECAMAVWDRDCFQSRLFNLTMPITVVQSTSLIPAKGWSRVRVTEYPDSKWLVAMRKEPNVEVFIIESCGHYLMPGKTGPGICVNQIISKQII